MFMGFKECENFSDGNMSIDFKSKNIKKYFTCKNFQNVLLYWNFLNDYK